MKKLISFAARFIPRHYLQRFAGFLLKIISWFYRGNKFEDPITGIHYRKLLPYGRIDTRKNALAPDSMSLERHRLLWLFLQQKTDLFTSEHKFLHIAPEFCFKKIFKKLGNINYITGDLISPWADVKMDIMDIPFEDNSFSVIMCNHVLEHVINDKKAMSEFYRVMKPGGWGIFQVPIEYNNKSTLEDPNINTSALREKHYWQKDHLRLYGTDYGNKLKNIGFVVTEDDFVKKLPTELQNKYALPVDEIIYFCQKPTKG